MITLHTPQLSFTLRPWQLSDLPSLVKHGNNKKIFDNMRDMFPYPYTEEAGIKFLHRIMADKPTKVFAIEIDNEACGSIGIFPQEDISRINAELGYWLSEKHWGKGIITAAVKEMVKYGFETWPIQRIYAIPFPENKASQKVLQKAGFRLEATIEKSIIKNNIIQDELIYAIRRS